MANVTLYRYSQRQVDIVGTPILTTDPTTFVNSDQTSSGVVFAGVDLSVLRDFNGYQTEFPLLMKLFCKDIVTDRTGEFVVTVEGSMAPVSVIAHRNDDRNFGLTWNVGSYTGRSWETIQNSDATVSVKPIAPMTSVKMNCLLGVATDNIDRREEN